MNLSLYQNRIMSPTVIYLILSLVEEAVKDTPGIIADLQEIFSKPNPTPADWEALRAKVLSKSYGDYVPASALAGGIAPAKIPGVNTAAPETKSPINDSGASPEQGKPAEAATSAQVPEGDVTSSTPAAVAAPQPYLPDGSRNPDFNHLASPTPAKATA